MTIRRILVSILLFLLKLFFVIAIAVGITRLGGYAYEVGYSLYDNSAVSSPPGKDVAIVIPEGCSVSRVAELLEYKGLIKNALVFRLQEQLSKYKGEIQAGSYVLNTSQTAWEILAVICGQKVDAQEAGT